MDPLKIIEKYYDSQSEAYRILVKHSRSVANKALSIAEALSRTKALPAENIPPLGNILPAELDIRFIEEAAMLHDIGIFLCNAPEIDCHGTYRYLCHGYLGADLLRKEGYPRHAHVCERHTGTGISRKMIKEGNLPLPNRDLLPVTPEEQLICFADKFFSKTKLNKEKSVGKVQESISKYGEESVLRFNHWCKLFLVNN